MSRQEVWVKPLRSELLGQAKQSFATRRVPRSAMSTLVGGAVRPRSGDVVLARIARLGHHKHVEQLHGRWRVKDAKLQPLWADTLRTLRSLPDGWTANHVPRAQNTLADALANLAIDRVMAGGPESVVTRGS